MCLNLFFLSRPQYPDVVLLEIAPALGEKITKETSRNVSVYIDYMGLLSRDLVFPSRKEKRNEMNLLLLRYIN